MQLNSLLTRTLLIVIFLGFVFILMPKNRIENEPSLLTADTTDPSLEDAVSSGLPVRLKIPKMNVDATIEYVGLTEDGAVGVPKGPNNVAWFNLGPRPGEVGSSILDGHSGYKNNKPAIFDNLNKLRKGDKIYVEDSKGETVTFIVQKLKTYAPNGNASDVFSSSDDKAHLNLITCTGSWNDIERTHSDRLVVFADKK